LRRARGFFGGARGGGKTDGVLGKWALKERKFGSNFNAVGFRRTSVSFEDAIDRAKQIYVPLGAKFADRPARFKMPNGGRVSFSYLENTDDAQEYQGRNILTRGSRKLDSTLFPILSTVCSARYDLHQASPSNSS